MSWSRPGGDCLGVTPPSRGFAPPLGLIARATAGAAATRPPATSPCAAEGRAHAHRDGRPGAPMSNGPRPAPARRPACGGGAWADLVGSRAWAPAPPRPPRCGHPAVRRSSSRRQRAAGGCRWDGCRWDGCRPRGRERCAGPRPLAAAGTRRRGRGAGCTWGWRIVAAMASQTTVRRREHTTPTPTPTPAERRRRARDSAAAAGGSWGGWRGWRQPLRSRRRRGRDGVHRSPPPPSPP